MINSKMVKVISKIAQGRILLKSYQVAQSFMNILISVKIFIKLVLQNAFTSF